VAEENRQGNGRDEADPVTGPQGRTERTAETPSRRKPKAAPRAASRPRPPREPAVNTIEARRRPKRDRASRARAAEGAPAPASPAASAPLQPADGDPWTVPQSVRDRFVQEGHRFYFPDGAPAFKDLGRRLTTASENTQLVHSLIEIAHSRGWTEVRVSGTERFRREAWQQARLAGLNVRGYRPSEAEQAQLIRALSRSLVRSPERVDAISVDAGTQAPARETQPGAGSPGGQEPRERITGKLVDHGRDAYRHDPNEDPSYFVRLKTREGIREIWGKDIERALGKSLTQPQIGDEVVLARTGRDLVTVKRPERGADGQLTPKEVDVFRNRWVIEKQEFFEQRAAAAQIVRNESIAARDAVRQHPELTGTYLNLRAAELASRALRDPEDQRRFVAQVRGALADDVERGEPLQPVRLHDRTVRGRTSRLNEDPQPSR
jgi:Large polyvalent protein-associated domain 7